ncbi:hypothetical protein M569_12047 [Genlisea aurea]|uniref:Uncharacterized protein n=1 Tax=Genlisea aurea TaxID=192259 RepID=S8DSF2_9LAMI|nr:hypothetical protein M569_12047 [Genlisea aurea]
MELWEQRCIESDEMSNDGLSSIHSLAAASSGWGSDERAVPCSTAKCQSLFVFLIHNLHLLQANGSSSHHPPIILSDLLYYFTAPELNDNGNLAMIDSHGEWECFKS